MDNQSIRKCLANNWNLPKGMDELPIPRVIKSYLKLDDLQYEFNLYAVSYSQSCFLSFNIFGIWFYMKKFLGKT